MTKGLALSGGGARGSFQMGAIDCLYTVFGYRPDVIAGTSVGSVNALVLAQASSGNDKLTQMTKLRSIWLSLTGPNDFYTIQPWLARILKANSLDFGGGLSPSIPDLIAEVVFNPGDIERSTSLAVLDPLGNKMAEPGMVDLAKLATGVPLLMASVSLETGRLRYATGDGRFVEEDGVTPVASALPPNAIPGLSAAQNLFTRAMTAVRTTEAAIETERATGDPHTKWKNIARLKVDLDRARWQADAALDALATANASQNVKLNAPVQPITGALASAAIPGAFRAYRIGEETYVDGGVRETVPVRAAVQLGATEVVAIVCSTLNLPKTGDKSRQNFFVTLFSSLSDITLKEVVEDDLAAAGSTVPVTTIVPNFDVHDTAVVDMGLIRISMAYGFMRAADVMSGLSDPQRRMSVALSDAITRIREETHRLSYAWTNPNQTGAHAMLEEFRFRKWLLRGLVESRVASKVALPGLATLWFQGWEDGSSQVPFVSSPWQEFKTAAFTTPQLNPYAYVPSGKVFDQEGDLTSLYVVQAGAVFAATPGRIAAVAPAAPALTAPARTTDFLPKIPVAGTVVAEVPAAGDTVETGGEWFVDGKRRYLLSTAAVAAMTLPPTTPVPVGGLRQIPDGGTPYWAGKLVIADSQPALIHTWDPSPILERNSANIQLLLWNQGSRPATVTSITFPLGTGGGLASFTPTVSLPLVVDPFQIERVPVTFAGSRPGPITGIVAVDCDDPVAPRLRVPLATEVLPLGAHGELDFSPSPIAFGSSLVGSSTGQYLTITNVGDAEAEFNTPGFEQQQPVGQFAIPPVGVSGLLAPGDSAKIWVSYSPSQRGAAEARLAIDLRSRTGSRGTWYTRRYEIPVTGSAKAPQIFLARGPRLPFLPPTFRDPELQSLDFGAAALGQMSYASFWVRNLGDAPLTVPQPVSHSGHFGIVLPSTLPATLQPGAELEVPCEFLAEQIAGLVSASQFEIRSDDPVRPTVMLGVLGRAAGPHLTEPNETYDFGAATMSSKATLTFTSDGTTAVTVTRVGFPGAVSPSSPIRPCRSSWRLATA